mmetsp:Transcript_38128/g.76275  ORF Transcript_38128/g.76275 Transcript_38128/m.76275 type:complete len:372 (-) Transcript_38128:128-1243(-)
MGVPCAARRTVNAHTGFAGFVLRPLGVVVGGWWISTFSSSIPLRSSLKGQGQRFATTSTLKTCASVGMSRSRLQTPVAMALTWKGLRWLGAASPPLDVRDTFSSSSSKNSSQACVMLSRKLLKPSTSICTFSFCRTCSSCDARCACLATSLKAMPDETTDLSSAQLLFPFSTTFDDWVSTSGANLIHFPGRTPTAMMSMRAFGGRKSIAMSGRCHGVSAEGTRENTVAPASSRRFRISSMFSGASTSSLFSRMEVSSLSDASRIISRSSADKSTGSRSSWPTSGSRTGKFHATTSPSAVLGTVFTSPWNARNARTLARNICMFLCKPRLEFALGVAGSIVAGTSAWPSFTREESKRSTSALAGQAAAGKAI